MSTFADFDLLSSLQETLAEKGLKTPTEIQAKTLEKLLGDDSIVGVAQTGSGKTLAYVLPILHKLKTLENDGTPVRFDARPRALVVVPTRDLGEQVTRVFKPFTHNTRLRVRALLGRTTFPMARRAVSGAFEVLVATPGRLVKLLEMELVDLSDVRTLVFDEADQMLDRSFLPDATRIVSECWPGRQMALFSATVPKQVQHLIEKLFADATVIRSEGSHKVVSTLVTKNEEVIDGQRGPVLERVLGKPGKGGTIIFANTRAQVDQIGKELEKLGKTCVLYKGEMEKVERRRNLKKFREGQVEFLISTDLASRGLDVDHVSRVINYHLPQQMENYLHRVGRTARAGRKGLVINFVTERDAALISKIETSGKSGRDSEWPEAPAYKKKSPIKPVVRKSPRT